MNIHEYQGKALFKAHGVKVLDGVHCTSVDDALQAYDTLQSKVVAVKSQIHAGGRGKGNLYAPESGDLVMEGITRSPDSGAYRFPFPRPPA